MQHIETVTVGSGGASSISFTSISADYTDLLIVAMIRTSRAAVVDGLLVKPNDSTSNFSWRRLFGTGSSTGTGTGTTTEMALVSSADNTSNTFGSLSCYIANYGSNTAKALSADSITENNATAGYPAIYAGLWNDSTAITSIVLESATGSTIVEYSTASLYGITAGSDGTTTVS